MVPIPEGSECFPEEPSPLSSSSLSSDSTGGGSDCARSQEILDQPPVLNMPVAEGEEAALSRPSGAVGGGVVL